MKTAARKKVARSPSELEASRPVHEPEKLKWWNWKDTS